MGLGDSGVFDLGLCFSSKLFLVARCRGATGVRVRGFSWWPASRGRRGCSSAPRASRRAQATAAHAGPRKAPASDRARFGALRVRRRQDHRRGRDRIPPGL